MKYFTAKIDGKDEILGSAGATKRYLKAHPEIESVVRWWWSGSDLIDAEDFTRDEILGQTVKQSETGATAQWAYDHHAACEFSQWNPTNRKLHELRNNAKKAEADCLSVNVGQARADSRQQKKKFNHMRANKPTGTDHPQPKKDEHTVKTQIPTKQDWRNRGIEAPETAATAPEAPRETTFCPKCQMNVMNTRIEHHQTWCNKELSISTQSALAIDALTRSLGAAAKPAHTPWHWNEETAHRRAKVLDSGNLEICDVYGIDRETRNTNARLIAAAPELLELLKRAASYVPETQVRYPNPLAEQIRAAIAKAEGSDQ